MDTIKSIITGGTKVERFHEDMAVQVHEGVLAQKVGSLKAGTRVPVTYINFETGDVVCYGPSNVRLGEGKLALTMAR